MGRGPRPWDPMGSEGLEGVETLGSMGSRVSGPILGPGSWDPYLWRVDLTLGSLDLGVQKR